MKEDLQDHSQEEVNDDEYTAFLKSLTAEIRELKQKCPILFEAMDWPENRIPEEETEE